MKGAKTGNYLSYKVIIMNDSININYYLFICFPQQNVSPQEHLFSHLCITGEQTNAQHSHARHSGGLGQLDNLINDLHSYQTFGTSGENYCHWMKGYHWESDVAKTRELDEMTQSEFASFGRLPFSFCQPGLHTNR